jgi:predicted metallo-beta-lactamase superfamily hydrolase
MEKQKANIKTVQIAFNLDDPFQEKLYNYMKQFKNASFYGKSLIQKDMNEAILNSSQQQKKGGITYVVKN